MTQGVVITLALLMVLGAVFLAGFREAVRSAIPLVGATHLNAAVVVGLVQLATHPDILGRWQAGRGR